MEADVAGESGPKAAGRVGGLVARLWVLATAVALARTLGSIDRDGFDGLNNLVLLVLAFPWSLSPRPVEPVVAAYVDAAFGALNAALLYLVIRRLGRPDAPERGHG